jgi:hypothetical protein
MMPFGHFPCRSQRAKELTMRSTSVFCATMLLVVGLAVVSLAQQRPDGQASGRGGRGGPPGGGFFRPTLMGLLQIDEVRKELELADEQVAEIQKVQEELRAKYPFPFGGRGDGGRGPGGEGDRNRRGPGNDRGSLADPAQWYFVQQNQQPGEGRRRGFGGGFSEEDRARFEQQRRERAKEEKARLSEILLPEQMKRLNEIYIQQLGVGALQDEDVAKELGISESQMAKLSEVRQQNEDSFRAAARDLFSPDGDREANRAKAEAMRKANDAKLLAVLSRDQQRKFEELKGKPFQLPEGAGRGGPGRGGPGRGGPGGTRGRGDN